MEKRVLTFEEYKSEKINEGMLDSIVNFFKGIFDLFKNEKVKKSAKHQAKRFSDIEDDDDVSDDEIESMIDAKRVRKTASNMNSEIENAIKVEAKSSTDEKVLLANLSGWLGMIIAQCESIRMPIIQKIVKDPILSKKFTFVPSQWIGKTQMWYKQKECVLDKTLADSILKTVTVPNKERKNAILNLSKLFIKTANTTDKTELANGLSAMIIAVNKLVINIIEKTPDKKLKEVIAEDIKTVRAKAPKKTKKKETENVSSADDENSSSGKRSERRLKAKSTVLN